jgi:ArsR family transcriptional regulator, arsenate/arsenite/antimonite-responsive transcriptional repressor
MTNHAAVNRAATGDEPARADLAVLRLLADPLRLRLVTLLANEQLCTCHLADETGALPTAVSNHLRQLREAGLVEREAYGRYTYYRLQAGILERLAEQLASMAARAGSATKRPC